MLHTIIAGGRMQVLKKFRGVDDRIAIALLGQEELPLRGELLIARVTGYESIKAGAATIGLGP